MKRILTFVTGLALLVPALVQCSKEYDDSWIKSKFEQIDSKLSNLESNVNSLNSYKTIVDNLQKGKVIDKITDNGDGTFSIYYVGESTPVVIKTVKGDKGDPGTPGDPGKDGDPGAPGDPGQDGVTPEFKIEDGDWFVSYDQGATWTRLGSASSSESLFFKNVYVDGDYLVLVLIDGTEVRISLKKEEPATIDDWVGNWKYDAEDIVITKSSDERCLINWYDQANAAYVQIPIDFVAETGEMTLSMPENRAVGGNYDSATGTGISYYLNLYTAAGSRVSPDPAQGTLIATFRLNEDKTAATATSADPENFYYFFARPYNWGTGKWGSSVFYMYCTDESQLIKADGGGETSTVPTMADWMGNWNKEGVSTPTTICFYEAGSYFMCYAPTSNFNDFGVVFDFNEEDGTWTFSVYDDKNGYAGYRTVDGAYEYFYFYAQHVDESGQQSYLTLTKGATLLKGTLSADKKTVTITSGIEECNKVPLYNQTIKTWCTLPGNWLGTYTKAE